MRTRIAVVACLLGCASPVQTPSPPPNVRFVTFNVGNPDTSDPRYALRIRSTTYEEGLAAKIQSWVPDVIALQEVLPPETCAAFEETDPTRTCYHHTSREVAVKRLLGEDYTAVCDQRAHVDCIGVRTSFGTIDGAASGTVAVSFASTPPLPLPPCIYAAGACDNTKCDAESTVSAVSVTTAKGPLRVIHVHPNATGQTGDGSIYVGAPCRAAQLVQAFALAGEGATLILGDWNFNPDSPLYPDENDVWDPLVGEGKRFRDHDERDESGRRVPTHEAALLSAVDHVVTDFATGECDVLEDRVDADFEIEASDKRGRTDHRPTLCDLYWP